MNHKRASLNELMIIIIPLTVHLSEFFNYTPMIDLINFYQILREKVQILLTSEH